MKPANHRIISLAAAIARFNIEELSATGLADPISERLDEDAEVLVCDGDTLFAGDMDMSGGVAFGEPYNAYNHIPIIVNGHLEARNIHLWNINGLFVFGSLTCDKIHLREGFPLYVQGNLIARQAILATAEQEGPSGDQEQFGPGYVRIKGTAYSPRIQTWFMPLHHLNWTADSGKELAEDKIYNSDKYLTDPVWKF